MDNRVKQIFNEMEKDYDEIVDLWYSWIFSRLHYLIAKNINSFSLENKKVLDIGCGTGFQSFLYSKVGAEVVGIDLAEKLIEVANKKKVSFNHLRSLSFFDPKYDFVKLYDEKTNKLLSSHEPIKFSEPMFVFGDAESIEFPDLYFDHINCCGSTFSFIQDYKKAISEMSRCLKPSGTFILEVESKNNLDLLWTFIDSTILCGKLEYETPFNDAFSHIFKNIGKHIQVEYPYGDIKNPVYMNIRLFKKRKLINELKSSALKVEKSYSIHSVTNIIPSTILDSNSPNIITKSCFKYLSTIEERLPLQLPGCSLVLIGRKIN